MWMLLIIILLKSLGWSILHVLLHIFGGLIEIELVGNYYITYVLMCAVFRLSYDMDLNSRIGGNAEP